MFDMRHLKISNKMWTIQTNFYFKIGIVNAFNADVSK